MEGEEGGGRGGRELLIGPSKVRGGGGRGRGEGRGGGGGMETVDMQPDSSSFLLGT